MGFSGLLGYFPETVGQRSEMCGLGSGIGLTLLEHAWDVSGIDWWVPGMVWKVSGMVNEFPEVLGWFPEWWADFRKYGIGFRKGL